MKRSVVVVDPATLEAAVDGALACGDPIRAAVVKDLTRRHRFAAVIRSRQTPQDLPTTSPTAAKAAGLFAASSAICAIDFPACAITK
jgi:hypothetical protein